MPLMNDQTMAALIRDGILLMKMSADLEPMFIKASDCFLEPPDGGSTMPWMRSIFWWPDEEGGAEVFAAIRFGGNVLAKLEALND